MPNRSSSPARLRTTNHPRPLRLRDGFAGAMRDRTCAAVPGSDEAMRVRSIGEFTEGAEAEAGFRV